MLAHARGRDRCHPTVFIEEKDICALQSLITIEFNARERCHLTPEIGNFVILHVVEEALECLHGCGLVAFVHGGRNWITSAQVPVLR